MVWNPCREFVVHERATAMIHSAGIKAQDFEIYGNKIFLNNI